MKRIFTALLILTIPLTSHALFGKKACVIKSPVRGLRASGITPYGFDVEWKVNLPPQIPTDMRMTINGRDARPGVPWWTLLLKPGVGASEWDHGIQPDSSYTVTIKQRSVCGKWSSATIVVKTPPAASKGNVDYSLEEGIREAEAEVADFNRNYQWAEIPPCRVEVTGGQCPDGELALLDDPVDPLNVMAGKYRDAKVESIVDDGVHTFIKTADGSPAVIYATDPVTGSQTRINTYYDAETGITVIEGDVRGYTVIVSEHQVVIDPGSSVFGSGAH